jgi:hypothetical protein
MSYRRECQRIGLWTFSTTTRTYLYIGQENRSPNFSTHCRSLVPRLGMTQLSVTIPLHLMALHLLETQTPTFPTIPSIKPSWMRSEEGPVNLLRRLLTIHLGHDRVLLLEAHLHHHESRKTCLVEKTRCKRFESCSTGRHVSREEILPIDRNIALAGDLHSCHACRLCKLLKNGRMLLGMTQHGHQSVCMVRRPVLVHRTHLQFVENRRTKGYRTGSATGE